MVSLADVKASAAALFAQGQHVAALRLYDAIAAGGAAGLRRANPRRRRRACPRRSARGERLSCAARYCLDAGHPLAALVCARVLEAHGGEAADLVASLVVTYGSESERLGKLATRIALPPDTTPIAVPDVRLLPPPDAVATAISRAEHATDNLTGFPEALHAIPLLSTMSEAAFRRVLGALVLRRFPVECARDARRRGWQLVLLRRQRSAERVRDPMGWAAAPSLHGSARARCLARWRCCPRSRDRRGVRCLTEVESTRGWPPVPRRACRRAQSGRRGAARVHARALARQPHGRRPALFKPFNRMQQRDLLRRFTSHDVAPGHGRDAQKARMAAACSSCCRASSTYRAAARTVHRFHSPASNPADVFGEMSLLRNARTAACGHRDPAIDRVLFLAGAVRRTHRRGRSGNQELSRSIGRRPRNR